MKTNEKGLLCFNHIQLIGLNIKKSPYWRFFIQVLNCFALILEYILLDRVLNK